MIPNTLRSLATIAWVIHHASASVAGPELEGNFADPCIIYAADSWYSFATNPLDGVNVQYSTSADFDTWALQVDSAGTQVDAMPDLPSWVDATTPEVWAPDVSVLSDGSFVMYFCALNANDTSKHCVGAATSSTIEGPYTATSDEPLICPLDQGGAIDPDGFLDSDGQRFIVYKIDGNSIGNGGECGNTVAPIVPTPLMLQPVTADGITFDGDAVELLDNDGAADDGILEGPSLLETDDGYVLFFCSGCYTTTDYTVSYATSTNVTGPFTRQGALFATGDDSLSSPGGADISRDGIHMVFHATTNTDPLTRELYTAEIGVASDLIVTG